MVISTTALAISGIVAGLSIVAGALIANGQKDKGFEIENTIDNIERGTGIKNENNTTDKPILETLTDDTIKIEKPKEEQTTTPTIDNTSTLSANERMELSKGNIIENYLINTPNVYDDGLKIGIGSNPPIPNIETKTDEKVTVNTVNWDTLVGEEKSPNEDDNNKKEEEKDQPGYIPNPGDNTDENLEEEVPYGPTVEEQWELWKQIREEQWAREDAIRKETQEREDTAYQRAIADMRKAGINPNLIGINPAESGGGITQASMPDMGMVTNQMNIDLKELQQIIDNNFKGDENEKDRLQSTLTSIISMIGMMLIFKK